MENKNIRLRQLRIERGLTIQNVAEIIGVSQGSYNYYELGKTEPNISMLKKLADFFCVSIDYLVGATPRISSGETLTDSEADLLKFFRGVDNTSQRATLRMLKSLYVEAQALKGSKAN